MATLISLHGAAMANFAAFERNQFCTKTRSFDSRLTRMPVTLNYKRLQAGATLRSTEEETNKLEIKNTEANERKEQLLLSVAPVPIVTLAAAEGLRTLLEPVGEIVRSLNLPDWLVHWGHPGNMAVVLFAMGGYGTYLGWQIRLSDDGSIIAKAKDMHPKLLGGMFFFFALGATGGLTSLVTSGKPIFESPHSITGMIGLGLLTTQSILSANFAGKPELRTVHAYLGSSIMALFLVHAALGLQLGLSF